MHYSDAKQVSIDDETDVPDKDLRKVLAEIASHLNLEVYKGNFNGEVVYQVRTPPRWD